MRPLAALAMLAVLVGCTRAEVIKTGDGYEARLTRIWSHAVLEVGTPDGGMLRYSSSPETAATDRMLEAFLGGRLRASE